MKNTNWRKVAPRKDTPPAGFVPAWNQKGNYGITSSSRLYTLVAEGYLEGVQVDGVLYVPEHEVEAAHKARPYTKRRPATTSKWTKTQLAKVRELIRRGLSNGEIAHAIASTCRPGTTIKSISELRRKKITRTFPGQVPIKKEGSPQKFFAKTETAFATREPSSNGHVKITIGRASMTVDSETAKAILELIAEV